MNLIHVSDAIKRFAIFPAFENYFHSLAWMSCIPKAYGNNETICKAYYNRRQVFAFWDKHALFKADSWHDTPRGNEDQREGPYSVLKPPSKNKKPPDQSDQRGQIDCTQPKLHEKRKREIVNKL